MEEFQEKEEKMTTSEKVETRAEVDYCKELISICLQAGNLGCRDLRVFYLQWIDFNLLDAYQDHLNTLENFLRILQRCEGKLREEVLIEALSRLRVVMWEINKRIATPIAKRVRDAGDREDPANYNNFVNDWNKEVERLQKVGEALRHPFDFQPLIAQQIGKECVNHAG